MQAQVPHIATADRIEELASPEVREEIRSNHERACHELHDRSVDMAKRRGAIDAAEADLIVEALELSVWMQLGLTSLTAYLEHVLGHTPRIALERERVARALRELPNTYESLRHGLHWTKVRELTRVATPDTENAWLDAAQDKNVRRVEALVRGHKRGDLPSDPTTPCTAKQAVYIEMTQEEYAAFRQAKSALSDECGENLEDAQALAIMARRALAPAPASKPAAQVAYKICPSCRATVVAGGGIVADVDPISRDCALCDAEDLGDLDAAVPERVASVIPPRVRRQVLTRDDFRCTVPGCRGSQGLELHHVKHREDGGNHEILNLTTLCIVHHKIAHAGRLEITRSGDKLTFRRVTSCPDGVADLGSYDLDAESACRE